MAFKVDLSLNYDQYFIDSIDYEPSVLYTKIHDLKITLSFHMLFNVNV